MRILRGLAVLDELARLGARVLGAAFCSKKLLPPLYLLIEMSGEEVVLVARSGEAPFLVWQSSGWTTILPLA